MARVQGPCILLELGVYDAQFADMRDVSNDAQHGNLIYGVAEEASGTGAGTS